MSEFLSWINASRQKWGWKDCKLGELPLADMLLKDYVAVGALQRIAAALEYNLHSIDAQLWDINRSIKANTATQRALLRLLAAQADPAQREIVLKPVSDLNFSVRVRKVLRRLGIETIGQLLEHSADDLIELKNFGETSLREVQQKLAELNLRLYLRGDEPESKES